MPTSLPALDGKSRLIEIDAKINSILPPRYQHCYADVPSTSMGSASVQVGQDGKVDWDQIWTSFCDLAIAGGPPHRGKWLLPTNDADLLAEDPRYQEVFDELSRAFGLVTHLTVTAGMPGWIGVLTQSCTMAAWLTCAIIAENVAVYRDGETVYLPVAPTYRIEKEIKNVVAALAKTNHYWSSHGPAQQDQHAFAKLLDPVTFCRTPLPDIDYDSLATQLQSKIQKTADWSLAPDHSAGWVGVVCPEVETTIWLLRVMMVSGITVRREEAILYLPTGDGTPQQLQRVADAWAEAMELWRHRG